MSKFNLNQPIPILLLGDGPDQKTGLGRLGHDLAWLLSSMPEFKVGYLGLNVMGRAKYPWATYAFSARDQWGEMKIQEAWEDLSQGVHGIILTLWDASRLTWFADPTGLPKQLAKFLLSGNFERWGYFMQDSEGVMPGKLPMECAEVFSRFNRVLLASKWALNITTNTVQLPDVCWIPHGINTQVFKRSNGINRAVVRSFWEVGNEPVIGCVMSNNARKHWPVVFEAVASMPSQPKLWIHTDRTIGYWNLNALAVEYGLVGDRIILEDRPLSDSELAARYEACDATIVISGGEGFCYPVAESLACGTPVVTGSYGAAAELVDTSVRPIASSIDTSHNVRRALYRAEPFISLLEGILGDPIDPMYLESTVAHLDWKKLGPVWQKWFRKGLTQ